MHHILGRKIGVPEKKKKFDHISMEINYKYGVIVIDDHISMAIIDGIPHMGMSENGVYHQWNSHLETG